MFAHHSLIETAKPDRPLIDSNSHKKRPRKSGDTVFDILVNLGSWSIRYSLSIYLLSIVHFQKRYSPSSASTSNSETKGSLLALTNSFVRSQESQISCLDISQSHRLACSRWVFKSPTCGRPLRSTPSAEKHEVCLCSTLSTCMVEYSLSHGSVLCLLSGHGESQKSRCWRFDNLTEISGTPFHPC